MDFIERISSFDWCNVYAEPARNGGRFFRGAGLQSGNWYSYGAIAKDNKSIENDAGIMNLICIRPTDAARWSCRCKLDGNKVIWATDKGRWRVWPDDEVITYSFLSGGVEVVGTYTDGSSAKEFYTAVQLGK